MRVHHHNSFFHFHTSGLLLFCLVLFFITPNVYSGTTELLSDACISDITAGNTSSSTIISCYETPATAFLDDQPRWWGDMNGLAGHGAACAANPGFVVTNLPYADFQYDSFKYTFKNQAAVDRFLNDLPSLPGSPVNVISTDYIKSNPNADHALSSDGTAPRIREIIITTDRKIDGSYIRAHNGQVITQDVRIDLEFLPPYARSYTTTGNQAAARPGERTVLAYASTKTYNRYEWVQRPQPNADIERNGDGTFYWIQNGNKTYNFGTVFLESGTTGKAPILSNSGRTVVPPHTVYLKNTIFNDLHISSPAIGMTIGFAPEEKSSSSKSNQETPSSPDLDRYQELGVLDIRNLNVYLKGGNDIFMYANEDLDVCP